MQSDATTVDDYLSELDPDRKASVAAVREVILENLPDGYEEVMQYGMISYIVPTSILAETYNGQPLMYAALASQKRYMSLYLTNVYGDEGSAEWFRQRYAASGKKLNMGKSCVRFRKLEDLPLDVVGEAIALTPMDEFLEIYRASRSAAASRPGNAIDRTNPVDPTLSYSAAHGGRFGALLPTSGDRKDKEPGAAVTKTAG